MRNILLLLINFIFISSQTTSDKFINEEVTREINLKNKILFFKTNIQIKNKHTSSLNSYTYLLSKNNSEHLIYFSVKLNGKSCTTKQPEVEDPNYIYVTISFDPINKGETKTLTITEHYFESLSFLPKKITIKEDQLSLFQDTGNIPSIYETKSTKTTITLPPNTDIKSYTLENSNKKNEIITYSYDTIKPQKSYPIKIHYINNNPYIIMNHASKTYQVSHWGNIAVTEDYQMENIGAKLDGEFGRIDYNQYSNKGGKNALKKFRAILPLRAWGLWYRDEIGNISSSNAIREWDDVKLDLVPRFPILGGWKSNFGIGYNLPSKFHVNTDNNGNYVVNLTFGMPYSDLLARNYTVEVILPEGADDIKVNLNTDGKFDVVKNKFYGCLDLFGRNSVIIHMRNVYDIHKVYFQIRYKYSNALLFVKPVILIVYFFFIFVALILYSRGNLSLKKDSKVKVE
jgi:oligosaccharyltransferase complex subunit alpha (ribophorin I)